MIRLSAAALLTALILAICGVSAHAAEVNILDYGAKNTPGFDNTAAINAALSASRDVRVPYAAGGFDVYSTVRMTEQRLYFEHAAALNYRGHTVCIVMDGSDASWNTPQAGIENPTVNLKQPGTTAVKAVNARRGYIRNAFIMGEGRPGTTGIFLDGGSATRTIGSVGVDLDGFYVRGLTTGVLLDTTNIDKGSWCNWPRLRGSSQSCGTGVDFVAASTARFELLTQDCEVGLRFRNKSDGNIGTVRSEYDVLSVKFDTGSSHNEVRGSIPAYKDDGTGNDILTLTEATTNREHVFNKNVQLNSMTYATGTGRDVAIVPFSFDKPHPRRWYE